MKKLTERQQEVLANARDTGNPYRQANGQFAPGSWLTGYRMVVERMQKAGYLYGHAITAAGLEALSK